MYQQKRLLIEEQNVGEMNPLCNIAHDIQPTAQMQHKT
jgi:hypothetical protein